MKDFILPVVDPNTLLQNSKVKQKNVKAQAREVL
jgi:hypothetical protein